MGFYFRKSKSFGPFRINLSKSGIGLSTGIKGARLSIGPKGTYINMGRNGMYYRKRLGSTNNAKTNKSTNNIVSSNNYNAIQNNSVPSFNIGASVFDSNGVEKLVLKRIKNAKKYNTLWNTFLWISVFLGIGNPYILIFSALLIALRIIFRTSFVAEINCDLEDDDKTAWDEFISSLNLVKTSNRFWIIDSITKTYDSKNNFGTNSDITRKIITDCSVLKSGKLNFLRIKSNCTTFQINHKNLKILFLPELLIISNKKELSIHTYNQFSLSHSEIRFAENPSTLPKDAEVLEWKYQHITKDGSMDMRYKYNPQYPVCKYGMLSFSSPSGLLIKFELSNAAVSEIISNAFDKYVIALNTPITTNTVSNDIIDVDLKPAEINEKEPTMSNVSETGNELIDSLIKYTMFEEN